jgi:hypothetical protein
MWPKKWKENVRQKPWWTDRIKEAARRKIMRGGSGSKKGQKKKKWRRLNRAVKCMIKSGRRRTWEKFVLDFKKTTKETGIFLCSN